MTQESVKKIRISRVPGGKAAGGRYLVFDIEEVIAIRRNNGICAVLTGTMPQNPTQNLFLGLPVELRVEEVRLLVDAGAAYVADELAEHLDALNKPNHAVYLDSIKDKRVAAQKAFDEEKERVRAVHADKRKDKRKKNASASIAQPAGEGGNDSLFGVETVPVPHVKKEEETKPLPAITPAISSELVGVSAGVDVPVSPAYPFYRHLNSKGYYTTPGLRFGGGYSVYPGDPFRYHAHYLANAYGWNEEIPMLDVVTSGRLGTAVKKSFLFGAEQPASTPEEDGRVRMFCVEWAGM